MIDPANETIELNVKPNPFLYALEATRFFWFVVVFPLAVALLFSFRGLPLYLSLEVGLTTYFVAFFVLFTGTLLKACATAFIVTNKRVLLRTSILRSVDWINIPIQEIQTLETRSYNARYGSVFISSDAGGRSATQSALADNPGVQGRANLVVKPSGLSIWLSVPFTVPFLRGFYGFRRFDTFANLILELQSSLAR